MSAAAWKIGLVVLLGSVAGALMRQTLLLVLPRSREANSSMLLAGSSILGGLFGAAIGGGIMTTNTFTSEEQSLWLFGLFAALGTYGASVALATAPSPPQSTSLLRTAAVHVTLAILAAALGIGLIYWVRSASG